MTVTDHRSTGPTDVDGGPGGDAWAVLLPAGRHDAERLVHHDTLELAVPPGGPAPAPATGWRCWPTGRPGWWRWAGWPAPTGGRCW